MLRLIGSRLKNPFSILKADKIMFFGSGPVAYPSVKTLFENKYQNLHVVTQYSPRSGKRQSNQVQQFCQEKDIKCSTPIKSKKDKAKKKQEWAQFVSEIGTLDFGVVVSYGYMLPQSLIKCFRKGMIVAHPSLLPKYRGGAPIFHAIANGEPKTGVSFVEISQGKFDCGAVLKQVEMELPRKQKYSKIQADLSAVAAKNLIEVLQNIDSIRPGVSQSSLQQKMTPEEKKFLKAPIWKEKQIRFDQSAEKVYHLSRAIENPRINFDGKQFLVQLSDEYLEDQSEVMRAGSLKLKGKKLYVKCHDMLVRVIEWKEPSKRYLPIGQFVSQHLRGKQQLSWPRFE